MPAPLITLLTDFGTADHYVAAMKGVIAGICPEARFIDVSHEVPPYAVAEAAFTLGQASRCFPPGTIHLVVVDPGVGSSRRPILAEAGGHLFVGPDNGVLTVPLQYNSDACVRKITQEKYLRELPSKTFHGRDVFSPVAAHLAAGVPAAEFGPPIHDFVVLDRFAPPRRNRDGSWDGVILSVDRFGNLITSLTPDLIENNNYRWQAEFGKTTVTHAAATYSEAIPGSLFLIVGSSGYLEISIAQDSAANRLGARPGDTFHLRGIPL